MADKIEIQIDGKDTSGGAFKSASGGIGSLLKTAAGAAVGVAGFEALKGAIMGSIEAAGESAQVGAQTVAVLKSTGGAAGKSADDIGNLATRLSQVAPIDDEVIQSGENMLLTFKNIKGTTFDDATQSMLDMSTAMGTDTKNSAILLGKALNDPTTGLSALTRVGVTFTDGQKDQIKAMQASGDMAGAQAIILKELQSEFGGSAEAAGKTFPGQLAILKTALGNVQETIGGALLPVLVRLAQFAVPLVIGAVNLLSVWLPRISTMLSGPLTSAFQTVLSIGQSLAGVLKGPVLGAWDLFRDHAGQLLTLLEPTIAILGRFIQAIGKDGLTGAFRDLPGIIRDVITQNVQFLASIGGAILGLFQSINWGAVASTLQSGLGSALSTLASVGGQAAGLASHLFSMLVSAFQSIDWGAVGSTILTGLGTAFAALSTGAGLAVNFGQQLYAMILQQVTTTDWSGIAASITTGLSTAMNSATAAVSGAGSGGGIIGQLFGDAATIIGQLQPLFDGIMAGIQPIITNLQTSFAPVMAQLNQSFTTLAPLIDQLKPVLEAIGIVIGTVLVVGIGVLLGYIGSLVGAFTGALPGAIQAVTGVIEILIGIIATLSAAIIGIVKVANDLLHGDWSQAWIDAKQAVQGMADGVGLIISGLKDTVTGLISGMIGGVTGLVSGFKDTIIGYFQGMYDSLVGHSIVPDMIAGIIAAFTGMPGQILGIVSGLVSSVIGQFSDLATQMLAKGGEIISNLASGMTGAIGGVQTAAGSVVAAATGAFSDLGSLLKSAGASLIQGLINGITSKVGDLEGILGGITSKIPDWKGPLDKDAKLLQDNGVAIMGGLISGIQSQVPTLTGLLLGITDGVRATVTAAVRSVGSSGGMALASAGSSSTSGGGGAESALDTYYRTDPMAPFSDPAGYQSYQRQQHPLNLGWVPTNPNPTGSQHTTIVNVDSVTIARAVQRADEAEHVLHIGAFGVS